jgi:hypothetical protein
MEWIRNVLERNTKDWDGAPTTRLPTNNNAYPSDHLEETVCLNTFAALRSQVPVVREDAKEGERNTSVSGYRAQRRPVCVQDNPRITPDSSQFTRGDLSLKKTASGNNSLETHETDCRSVGVQWGKEEQQLWNECMRAQPVDTPVAFARANGAKQAFLHDAPLSVQEYIRVQTRPPDLGLQGLGLFLLSRSTLCRYHQFEILPQGMVQPQDRPKVVAFVETECRLAFPQWIPLSSTHADLTSNAYSQQRRPVSTEVETRHPAVRLAMEQLARTVTAPSAMETLQRSFPGIDGSVMDMQTQTFNITRLTDDPVLRIRQIHAHTQRLGSDTEGNATSDAYPAATDDAIPTRKATSLESIVKTPVVTSLVYQEQWDAFITGNGTGSGFRTGKDVAYKNTLDTPNNAWYTQQSPGGIGARAAVCTEVFANLDTALVQHDPAFSTKGPVRSAQRVELKVPVGDPRAKNRLYILVHITSIKGGGIVAEVDFTSAFLSPSLSARDSVPPSLRDLIRVTAEVVWVTHWMRVWIAGHMLHIPATAK